jgi:hypothetical protein
MMMPLYRAAAVRTPVRQRLGRRMLSDYSDISVMPLFASDAVRDKIQNGLKHDGYCILPGFAGADVALQMRGLSLCLTAL